MCRRSNNEFSFSDLSNHSFHYCTESFNIEKQTFFDSQQINKNIRRFSNSSISSYLKNNIPTKIKKEDWILLDGDDFRINKSKAISFISELILNMNIQNKLVF